MLLDFQNPTAMAQQLLVMVPIFLVSITLHEFGHALAADRLGDPTPRNAGRLSLNPLAHLDLLGTLMLLFAPFGWAKPVPINLSNIKNRYGQLIVSIAGPLANFILAVIGIAILKHGFDVPGELIPRLVLINEGLFDKMPILVPLLTMVLLNSVLMLFNLLPIPPLDGFGIISNIFPLKKSYYDVLPYGIIALVLIMSVPSVGRYFNLAIVYTIQGLVAIVP